MSRPGFLFALSLLSLVACDEEKKKADLLDATKPAETAPLVIPSASASAAMEAAKPKEPIVCPEGNAVKVSSPELEAQIRLKINKPKGDLDAADLAKVPSINLTTAKVDELDPCTFPKMTGLKFLYIGQGKLTDLRPIQTLVRLEGLRASINEVEDLKPLEKLVKLDQLDLSKTHVRDLSVLANLVNVTELQLDDTQVSDLTPLAKMTKLEHVSIQHTNVTDVSPLKDLKKLKQLDVAGDAISNINVLNPKVKIVTTPVTSGK